MIIAALIERLLMPSTWVVVFNPKAAERARYYEWPHFIGEGLRSVRDGFSFGAQACVTPEPSI